MGNCVGTMRLPSNLTKKTDPELVWKHMLTTSGCYHCKRWEEDWFCLFLGSCSCTQNASALPSCVFYSPRIQGLLEGERTELETTQEHWTQVNPGDDVEMESVGEENRKYFDEVLMKHAHRGDFFSKFEGLMVKDKIGEGGQGEIFGAEMKDGLYKGQRLVAKVFKKNVSLMDLERQCPIAILSKEHTFGKCLKEYLLDKHPINKVLGGAFIRNGIHKNRFVFVMHRRTCDLRAFLDQCMLNRLCKRIHHRPPFEDLSIVLRLLLSISNSLNLLHNNGIVHRDIKASNVLLDTYKPEYHKFCDLMDFECALGAMGTGFWRAPEILEQVQRRVPSHEVVFTKEADIYSFGMLCYEVITGCIPFDGHPQNDYSVVLGGGRPELPYNLCSFLEELLHNCWKEDPQQRPTAEEVFEILIQEHSLWIGGRKATQLKFRKATQLKFRKATQLKLPLMSGKVIW